MLRRVFLSGLAGLWVTLGGWAIAHAQEEQASQATEVAPPAEPPRPSLTENDLVVVIGGSGRTGRHAVQQLMDAGIPVRATTRDIEKAKSKGNEDFPWMTADVTDPTSLAAALDGATHVISAIGNARDPINVDYQGVVNAVDAAKAAGVKHFTLVSSAGTTHDDHYLNRMFNDLLKWKFKGEEHLRNSDLSYTVVRPYGLLDEYDALSKYNSILLLQGDDDPNGVILRSDVAKICIESLTHPDAANKTFEATNFLAFEPDKWIDQFAKMAGDQGPEE